MSNVVIQNPILNSPFEEPKRHFRFDDDGITNDVIEERRISSYFVPIPQARKRGKKGTDQLIDATKRFTPRRKILGAKNAERSDAHQATARDLATHQNPVILSEAKNPTRSAVGDHTGSPSAYDALPANVRDTLHAVAHDLAGTSPVGADPVSARSGAFVTDDYNTFDDALTRIAKQRGLRLTAKLEKDIQAAVADGSEKIGYEISVTRYFCKPQQLRTLAEIEADILALERETDGLLEEILVETANAN